ncbi:FecR family protein [[Flexibacter] sp. ATCC 35208]|uniref:FecR family protein n=1 Tax=[Flexibacter] sp. ATCC 35208 TaxID=1936242 RepID=UPI0009C8A1D5|nr:FecR family protein [[Flexibacter] sp. ATCC 35208]OMP80067.1 hypothetical protein BW716_06130 [[Flexibacter] sp. ATCC 35208]
MDQDEVWVLILKHIQQDITPQEAEQLAEWLKQGGNRQLFDRLTDPSNLHAKIEEYRNFQVSEDVAWKRLLDAGLPIQKHHKKSFDTWLPYIAAAALLLGIVAIRFSWFLPPEKSDLKINKQDVLLSERKDLSPGGDKAILTLSDGRKVTLDSSKAGQKDVQAGSQVQYGAGEVRYDAGGNNVSHLIYNTVTTPRGGKFRIVLPDGSIAWLNASSSLRYPVAFIGKERKVEMTGEIYFEVATNATSVFKVSTNKTEILVLGTSFNVNTYNNEPTNKTTLLSGRVKIRENITGKEVLLKPGQEAVLPSTGSPLWKVADADVDMTIAWKNGRFQFKGADIQTIMRQISRWYNVNVEYKGDIPPVEFTGKMHREAKASEILEVLKSTGIHFTIIDSSKIVVSN